MAVVLITGMSGAGKSTALAGLAGAGFETVDTDGPGWIERVDGEPLWRPERIDEALDRPRTGPLILLGTVANQGSWAHRFDAVVLLTAPVEVLVRRLHDRLPGEFGAAEGDRAQVAEDTAEVEPRLRAMATHVVDTSGDPADVVAALVAIVEEVAG
ncbi:AAA family ATPase [uncultured Amnibacterium sp.]|uniref:AAA family ATPase n=1 Tax=uncultured Amnibacterium sp. TaxID=1631851 RepID=UPI0035CBCCF8